MAPHSLPSESSVLTIRDLLTPRLIDEWVHEQNLDLTTRLTETVGVTTRQFWRCWTNATHIWQASIQDRRTNSSCPYCEHEANATSSPTGSLASVYPNLVHAWHPTDNAPLTPHDLPPSSTQVVRWCCPTNPAHSWRESVHDFVQHAHEGRPCVICEHGWSIDTLKLFLETLLPHLNELNSSELFLIAQQAGLLDTTGDTNKVIKGLIDQSITRDDLAGLLAGKQSLHHLATRRPPPGLSRNEDELPQLQTFDLLSAYDSPLFPIQDERAIAYLIESGVQKLWRRTLEHPEETLASLDHTPDTPYATHIKTRFLDEYAAVNALTIPQEYALRIDGVPTPPNMLQRLLAHRICTRRRTGIFTGTGSGKTIAALLGSRVINARVTVILSPHYVVPMWEEVILNAFPNSEVCTGTLSPVWKNPTGPRYLVLHYELLQLPKSEDQLRRFITQHPDLDCCLVDEQHLSKVRHPNQLSLRRQRLNLFTSLAAQHNPNFALVAMSATPILNTLEEGRSTLELIRGEALPHLETAATIPNAMRIHQEIVLSGFRWIPPYPMRYQEEHVEIDCTPDVPRIQSLPSSAGILELEQILYTIRLPALLRLLAPKTMIYSNMIEGIVEPLAQAIRAAGWSVGLFTGEHKDGVGEFLHGATQILIVSDVAAVGFDGFQRVCHRLICLNTPFTAGLYDQLRGRLLRLGQPHHTVEVFLLVAVATIGTSQWSWDREKIARLNYKRSLADAAVDGIVPDTPLQSQQQAYRHLMGWLSRLGAPTATTGHLS